MDHDIRAFGPKTTISGIAIFPGGSGNFSFEFNGIGIPINGNALPEPKEKKDE